MAKLSNFNAKRGSGLKKKATSSNVGSDYSELCQGGQGGQGGRGRQDGRG